MPSPDHAERRCMIEKAYSGKKRDKLSTRVEQMEIRLVCFIFGQDVSEPEDPELGMEGYGFPLGDK